MTPMLPQPFPQHDVSDDHNPAIRLFGKRFINEQGAIELLAEFLAVTFCEKRIGHGDQIEGLLPSSSDLARLRGREELQYRPPIKLNLKLFALLGASRVDTRHNAHLEHYGLLAERLKRKIRMSDGSSQEAVEWVEDLLRGFQGAGFNRTWCAQTFLPITSKLLTRETIWGSSAAKRDGISDWQTVVNNFSRYFSVSRRDFLARGGELLYLQLCNTLAMDGSRVKGFVEGLRASEPARISLVEEEPGRLHGLLQRTLGVLADPRIAAFDRLVDTIENLDIQTSTLANRGGDNGGWLSCEWCPQESWPEAYLFAIELSRMLSAAIDPVERLELMAVGCALQLLRSLCAQSARYADRVGSGHGGALGFAWLFTTPNEGSRPVRLASQRNLQAVQGIIQKALRIDELRENAEGGSVSVEKLYREADTKYGHKLFLSLGKKLGLIAPHRGPGARFIMTETVLRYLVLVLLRPGERCSYDEFLRRLYLHYGIAVEGEQLDDATAWSGLPVNSSIQSASGSWLAADLKAGGFLVELSDACSIVRNTYRPVEL